MRGFDKRGLGHDRVRQLHLLVTRLLPYLAGPPQGVLLGDRILDVGRRYPEGGHPVRVHPDAHRLVRHAENLCLACAVHALDRIQNVDVGIVGHVLRAVPAVLVVDCNDHQRAGRFFLHRNAVLRHRCGELRHGEIHPVLHLHLGDVGVGIQGEEDRQGHLAGARTRRCHVEHVVHAVDLRLYGRRYRVADRLRVGAWIGGRNLDLYRRDRRVLRHRQGFHRHQSGDHDDERDDRREDRPLDEEPGEHELAPPVSICRFLPNRCRRRRPPAPRVFSIGGPAFTRAPGRSVRAPSTTT